MKYSYLFNTLQTLLHIKNHKMYRFKCQYQCMYYSLSFIICKQKSLKETMFPY